MSSNRLRRIAKEIEETASDVHSKVTLQTAGEHNDLTHLEGRIQGPPDTPYEGGQFLLDIKIPSDYPFRPPNVKFKTKIWHPNVSSQTGAICLDTLSTGWSPVFTIKSALISIQGLLASPEPKDPQDAEVAGMLLKNPKQFAEVAKAWVIQYAGVKPGDTSPKFGESSGVVKEVDPAKAAREAEAARLAAYCGYPQPMVNRFCDMGFEIPRVVAAFEDVGIDRNDGHDYEIGDEKGEEVAMSLFSGM